MSKSSVAKPGAYDVTLTATNASGTGTITKTYVVTCSESYAMVSPGLATEDFDNSPLFYTKWHSEDLDANARTWWLTNVASYSGSQSVQMNAYYNFPFDVDNLYSPSFNIAYVGGATLSFISADIVAFVAAAHLKDNVAPPT